LRRRHPAIPPSLWWSAWRSSRVWFSVPRNFSNSIVFHSVDVLIPLSPSLSRQSYNVLYVADSSYFFFSILLSSYFLGILSRSVCPVILRNVLISAVRVMLLFLLMSVSAAFVIIGLTHDLYILVFASIFRNLFFHIMSFKHPAILEALSI